MKTRKRELAILVAAAALAVVRPAFAVAEQSHAVQNEKFAVAFGMAEPAKANICDPWLRSPPPPLGPIEDPQSADLAEPDVADPVAASEPAIEPAIPPHFLQSAGIPVRHSQYDERWRAVRDAGLSAECAHAILGNLGKPDSTSALAAFNRAVNGRIRYADDSKAGQADSWAPASQTLASGTGDCEDFAILKLQLLLALGVAEQDVYLTLVRDTVRKRDHAVVVVRSSGGATLLDSVSDQPIDADADTGYRPVIAFSGAQTWLLGTQRAGTIVPSSPR